MGLFSDSTHVDALCPSILEVDAPTQGKPELYIFSFDDNSRYGENRVKMCIHILSRFSPFR